MLRVHSIFQSVDGEISPFHQGRITTFLRLAGCNLRCAYCDTTRAWEEDSGEEMEPEEVVGRLMHDNPYKVTITGGEPLLQRDGLAVVVAMLHKQGVKVTIETNGSVPVPAWPGVGWVVDYKLPSSKMGLVMVGAAFLGLQATDFVKFVVADRVDFSRACQHRTEMRDVGSKAQFAFSPAHGTLDPATLVDWMKEAGLTDAVLSLQIHKYIYPDANENVEV